jgi:cytohesin
MAKHDILPSEMHHPRISQGELNQGLLEASRTGNHIEMESLLKAGADMNAKDNHGWTALSIAAFNGHLKTCELLIENGADVNAKDNINSIPLHWAAFHGHLQICRLLVEKGADVETIDKCNDMPHNVAAIQGHHRIAQFLRSVSNTKKEEGSQTQE